MDETAGISTEGWDEAAFERMRTKAAESNLDPATLLATDYLNHFNEIVMLLEMVADMPEILEECKEWQPKSYCDHFRDSTIADKDLAIEAYEFVPPHFKAPFEQTVEVINDLIAVAVSTLDEQIAGGNMDLVRESATRRSQNIQRLMDTASGIIHGSSITLAQADIDDMLSQ